MSDDFDITRLHDFTYYAPHLLKVKTKPPHPQIVPFEFWPEQRALNDLFDAQIRDHGFVRVNVLKSRRVGMSTLTEGRIFHAVHTTPNTHAFIVAHDKDGLNTIFDMSKLFYECLPPKFKPMKRYSSRKELVFENPNDKTRFVEPGLRSKIEVFSANKITASRSGGYSYAHFSEVAFYERAEELLTAVVPSIPDVPGTLIVRESTANGRGDFFHNEWLLAKNGESNYKNIFFSWLGFADYHSDPLTETLKRQLLSTLDDEEKVLRKKFHATPEQLWWRRSKLLDYHGDVDKFHQEYPTTDDEAFIASGQCYFNRKRLREYQEKTVEPIFCGDITNHGLQENDDGDLLLWELPEPDAEYVLGVDVSGGQEGRDASAIEILKVPKDSPHIVQVGEYVARLDPVILADKCVRLAKFYNDGLLSIELNNHGLTTLNEVKEHYWNLYRWQYFDRFGKSFSTKLGWETNVSTRPLLCDYASACVNADIFVIRSETLVEEMQSFIVREIGYGGEAEYGSYDDRVMAFMIGAFTLAHSHQSSSLLEQLGSFTNMNPVLLEDKKVKMILTAHDHDLTADPLQLMERDYTSGERGWLNY